MEPHGLEFQHDERARGVLRQSLVYCQGNLFARNEPTFDQVEGILWPEIAHVVKNARFELPGRLLTTSYEIGPKWRAIGRSTNKPERFSGFQRSPRSRAATTSSVASSVDCDR